MTTEQINSFNVAQLKEELRKRNLTVSGRKAQLQARLLDALAQNQQPPLPNNEPPIQNADDNAEPPPDEENMPLTVQQVDSLNVAELKGQLQLRGLSIHGRKDDLRTRLIEAIEQNVPIRDANDNRMYPNPGDGFSGTAHWELTLSNEPVPNPTTNK